MRRSNFVRPAVGAAVVALLTAFVAASALAAGSVSVVGRPAWANGSRFVRHAGRTERVDLAVVLGFRDQAGLDALTAAVSDPRSPSYGRYLTPAQFHARFAPAQSDVNAVASWLRSRGLHVTSMPANHLLVFASGTVAQAEAAFGTTINYYRVGTRTMRGPAASPAVPSSLVGHRRRASSASRRPRPSRWDWSRRTRRRRTGTASASPARRTGARRSRRTSRRPTGCTSRGHRAATRRSRSRARMAWTRSSRRASTAPARPWP